MTVASSLRRYLFEYPRRHLRAAGNRRALAACAAFLAAAISVRYAGFASPFFSRPPHSGAAEALRLGLEFGAFPYVVAVTLAAVFGGLERALDRTFWLIGLIAVVALGAIPYGDRLTDWTRLADLVVRMAIADPAGCASCSIWNGMLDGLARSDYSLRAIAGYTLGPLLLAAVSARHRGGRFGLTLQGVDLRAYGVILIVLLPAVVAASYRPDFLSAYPRYSPGMPALPQGAGSVASVLVFETLYALQFVALEYFFRGFLVFSLETYLGERAVAPMVCVYCFIHFVKPLPEATASVAGGYLLGVIALYSRSVVGGMPLHIGIALTLEALSFYRHLGS